MGRREPGAQLQVLDVRGAGRDRPLLESRTRLPLVDALPADHLGHCQEQHEGGGGLDGRIQVSIHGQAGDFTNHQ